MAEHLEYLSHNEAETEALGARLAGVLTAGTVVAYQGGLGMGKTAFTIVNEYLGGRLPLFHFDMYRLPDSDALFDIGWEDYLDRGGVCAVEWSEQVADALPEDTVTVSLARHPDQESWRIITIKGVELP